MNAPNGWRHVAPPTLFVAAAFVTFTALGTWQMERKSEKEVLIQRLEQRLSAAPAPLPSPDQWDSIERKADEFRRVQFTATFVPGEEALVYAGASGPTGETLGPGYRVVAAARLDKGNIVAVDRGFIPEGRTVWNAGALAGAVPQMAGSSEMTGIMRWPERRGYFAPKDDSARNLWFTRDHLAIAVAKGWSNVAPFYIELEAPVPANGWPRPGALRPHIRNEHLQYALTWYALAAAVVIMFGVWLRDRYREACTR
jgi:cytochrome oxidase assembly protein ShyY1